MSKPSRRRRNAQGARYNRAAHGGRDAPLSINGQLLVRVVIVGVCLIGFGVFILVRGGL